MVKTYGEAYRRVKDLLSQEGAQAPYEARELLSFVSGRSSAKLMGMLNDPISEQTADAYFSAAARILAGEPLAYILGRWSFYGLDLTVTSDVLIPRDDTMAVVDLALDRAILPQNARILDLCTGSGCIGLALASRIEDAQVILCDSSDRALAVAEKNVAEHHLESRVSCRLLDVLQAYTEAQEEYDLIISNPPYITGTEMEALQPSVREYEPRMALYGGEDGLDFYRAIIKNYTAALKTGGYLCFEFGQGQEQAICLLLQKNHYDVLEFRRDTGEIVRAVIAQKKERLNAYGNG